MKTRREFMRTATHGLAAGTLAMSPLGRIALAEDNPERILVVLELSGGNDGLNTLVPYGDDAYYRHRPRLGIRENDLLKLDDHVGFRKQMAGFERLYKAGKWRSYMGAGTSNRRILTLHR